MFRCVDCNRDCDVMIDGCHELMNCTEICDKCMFGEWTQTELNEREDMKLFEQGSSCHCMGGCEWCLCVEPRIGRG